MTPECGSAASTTRCGRSTTAAHGCIRPCSSTRCTTVGTRSTLKHVRGLDRVLPHLLPSGMHPTAVAGFLLTPQSELLIDGQPKSVREWLLHGQPLEPVLNLIDVADWSAT